MKNLSSWTCLLLLVAAAAMLPACNNDDAGGHADQRVTPEEAAQAAAAGEDDGPPEKQRAVENPEGETPDADDPNAPRTEPSPEVDPSSGGEGDGAPSDAVPEG